MIRRVIVRLLATLGALFLISLISVAVLVLRMQPDVPEVPDRAILELDLRAPLVEPGEATRIQPLGRQRPGLHQAVATLKQAAEDDRVLAVVARVDGGSQSLFASQDLHAALAEVREAGKPTFAYADTFGELGNGTSGYYLASGFDQIWLQPVGLVGLTGLATNIPFVADALAEYGVEAEFSRRTDYKTAMDMFTEAGLTDSYREMMESLLDDLYEQIVETVASHRDMEPLAVRDLIDRAPLTADEALAGGLIDTVAHSDAMRNEISETFDNDFEWMPWRRYSQAYRAEQDIPEEPRFALVHGNGPIVRGMDSTDPLSGDTRIGADSFAAAVERAVEDEVDAIVVRLSSPGGSAVASETARHALAAAREAGIPVVVSMGSSAASGGYWIAVESDHIVARPATLTGSIGVVAGKFDASVLWERLNVNWETVARGEHANMFSTAHGFTEPEQTRLDELLDNVYEEFRERVADGRHLDHATVEELARGRVWTGRQALDNGLIDALGGLHESVDAARDLAGIDEDVPVRLQMYPQPRTPLEQILELLRGEGPLARGTAERGRQIQTLGAYMSAWLDPHAPARMPPAPIESPQ